MRNRRPHSAETKKKKLEETEKEPTPEEVFTLRLMGQILTELEQRENAALRDELTKELAHTLSIVATEAVVAHIPVVSTVPVTVAGQLPSLSESLRSSFANMQAKPKIKPSQDVIVISDDEKEAERARMSRVLEAITGSARPASTKKKEKEKEDAKFANGEIGNNVVRLSFRKEPQNLGLQVGTHIKIEVGPAPRLASAISKPKEKVPFEVVKWPRCSTNFSTVEYAKMHTTGRYNVTDFPEDSREPSLARAVVALHSGSTVADGSIPPPQNIQLL